jgi:glyoxylase-like metal-dependent hydrolase (beta-lactamase superfamily II)
MLLHVLPAGPIQTNAYLLISEELHEAVLIDAPGNVWAKVRPLLASAHARLTELWLTHGHWDHTQGAAEVVAASSARVRAHAADRILIETPEVMEVMLGRGIKLTPVKVDEWVNDGDRWTALGTTVEVRHVPGHCPGNVLFHLPQLGTAFVGDALFAGSVGRTDLPGGDADTLARSIRGRIYTLPADTRILPGHGPETTVATERRTNPFVRDDDDGRS